MSQAGASPSGGLDALPNGAITVASLNPRLDQLALDEHELSFLLGTQQFAMLSAFPAQSGRDCVAAVAFRPFLK